MVATAVGWVMPFAWSVNRITHESAEAAIWLLIAAWAGWACWNDWPEKISSRPVVAGAVVGGWVALVWLTAGLWPEDYWLVRTALLLAIPALLVAAWGWRGLWAGWRGWPTC